MLRALSQLAGLAEEAACADSWAARMAAVLTLVRGPHGKAVSLRRKQLIIAEWLLCSGQRVELLMCLFNPHRCRLRQGLPPRT